MTKEPTPDLSSATSEWFVMRDLKRANAKQPAYRLLAEKGFEVYTPLRWTLVQRHGKRVRSQVPFLSDLLFVRSTRADLDPVVAVVPTLQYRFVRGAAGTPMVVPTYEMERFIQAVRSTDSPRYFSPEEITPSMLGRRIRIVGGELDGYEGHLLSVRGSRTKHLLVQLPSFLVASVEVSPEYIQFLV